MDGLICFLNDLIYIFVLPYKHPNHSVSVTCKMESNDLEKKYKTSQKTSTCP